MELGVENVLYLLRVTEVEASREVVSNFHPRPDDHGKDDASDPFEGDPSGKEHRDGREGRVSCLGNICIGKDF